MDNQIAYFYLKKEVKNISNNMYVDEDGYIYILNKISSNIDIKQIQYYVNLTKNSLYFVPVINRYNSIVSKIDNKNYVLFQTKGLINEKVSLKEILYNNKKFYLNGSYDTDISSLWSKKLDYLEYQVSELGKSKEEVLNTFSFFLGLGENAITFLNVNNVNFNNIRKTLCHYRINYPVSSNDYYNPLNLLNDSVVRDYSEYLKSKLLKDDDLENDVKIIFDNANLNNDELKLFYARLMFPTNYFDMVEDILLNEKKEDILDSYFEVLPRYLNFLKDTYYEIIKRVDIIIPDWIKIQKE